MAEDSKQARWQRKQKELGNCVICGGPSEGGSRCRSCYQRHYQNIRTSEKEYKPRGPQKNKRKVA